MIVFRISKKEHINDLSGIGAGLYGGRWNPRGLNMVYTSSSIALASLEFMVHNFHLLSTAKVCLAKIKIGASKSNLELHNKDLPINWNAQMSQQHITQGIGKEFLLDGSKYILKVPSAVVPGEFNMLLNPNHINHKKTKIIEIINPFVFDQRLLDLK